MDQSRIDEELQIANRRHDDIVLVIRHDFYIESKKSKIVIEFINEYGKFFFNIPNELLYSLNNEELYFENILDNDTHQIIEESLDEESNDSFKTKNLADILRKISNFTVLGNHLRSILVNLRVFPIYEKDDQKRKRNIKSSYYYLIIREIDVEMKIAQFRMNFLRNINDEVTFDNITNISDLKSTIHELKMLIEFNKKEKINVAIALIEIKENQDLTLLNSITNHLRKETRYYDYLGHFNFLKSNNKNQLLLILHGCDIEIGFKALSRLYTSVVGNQYIFDKYKNQRENILSIGYTQLKQDDNFKKIVERLNLAIKNNKNILSEIKISAVE